MVVQVARSVNKAFGYRTSLKYCDYKRFKKLPRAYESAADNLLAEASQVRAYSLIRMDSIMCAGRTTRRRQLTCNNSLLT